MHTYSSRQAQIDVADIWQFEQDRFKQGLTPEPWLSQLYRDLPIFYILKGEKPFASRAGMDGAYLTGEKRGKANAYFERYKRLYNEGPWWNLDFFKCGEAFYDLNNSCVINFSEVNDDLFSWLFALKLRQLEEHEEEMSWFLGFHFHLTFKGDKDTYNLFLIRLQLYPQLLKPETLIWIHEVETGHASLPGEEVYGDLYVEKPTWEEFQNSMNGDSIHESPEEDLEDAPLKADAVVAQPYPIENKSDMTLAEVIDYFVIFYTDRGDGEGPLLRKEQVEHMIRDGMTVPAQPLAERYKLNLSFRYPKKMADFFFYKFISLYNPRQKRDFLRFLGSYIEDYAQALDPKGLENLNKNFTGDKPKNLHLQPTQFLPKRFQ